MREEEENADFSNVPPVSCMDAIIDGLFCNLTCVQTISIGGEVTMMLMIVSKPVVVLL